MGSEKGVRALEQERKNKAPPFFRRGKFNSLFTSIPHQLALDCTENAIKNSTAELPLPTDDIMDLLNLCLTSTYFQYNGKHYKQLHGTAMGSPVSVVVTEIVMQNIEEQALATYTRTIVGFHMTSLKFKLKNYPSYRDFTFTMH